MENLVRSEYSANSWWYLCFIISLSLIYSSKINFIKYLLWVRNYLYVYTVGSRSEPLYQIGPGSFYWCWHSDDLENECSHSAEVAHLVFWMSSTHCSKPTLYPSAAHSVPPEGDLYAVQTQASFSPASSLVGQRRTQQVTQGRRRMKLECNPIYPLTQFMLEPSPHSPSGLWFQGKCYFPSSPQTSERQHLPTRLFLALGHSIILWGISTHNVMHNLFIKLSSDYSIWKASLSCQHAHWYNKVTGDHLLAT